MTSIACSSVLRIPRAVGGMRASIYNGMPIEDVKRFVEYMRQFEAKRG